MVKLDRKSTTALPDQIVQQIVSEIEQKILRPGYKLSSIRERARDAGVSTFTVAEAYDKLVALGYIETRPRAGFYVRAAQRPSTNQARLPERTYDYIWLNRMQLPDFPGMLNVSTGKAPQ